MATKIFVVAALFFIAITTTFSTCKKGGCANTVYNFEIGVKAYPDRDSIHIGDTLWVEINAPTTFTDLVSNNDVNYAGAANLGSAIGFGEFIGRDSVRESANSFEYLLIKGYNVNNPFVSKIREYLFMEQNNFYLFKLGIIPKEKGIFGIGFSNAANVFRANDGCTKARFNIFFQNTHQHYFLNPNINSNSADTTKPSGSYYFAVN
ncbi:MAG: hypothetical protein ABI691_05270 [Ginsengibacter sp.]